jgi:adenosylcobinamide-phosphate synthase
MTLLSLLFALLMEQVHPLKHDSWVLRAQEQWAHFISKQLDTGHEKHTGLIWGLCVGLPAVFVLVIYWLLWTFLGWILAGLWCVLVLYATLGFRQFSHHFTDIKEAFEAGEENLAKEKLAQWKGIDTSQLDKNEVTSLVIEYSILAAHQHVFGVLFWFSMGAAFGFGPAGAVIYRLSHLLSRIWVTEAVPNETSGEQAWVSTGLCLSAQSAWSKVDWLSSRVTALSFAVVGNFEDAIECWRNHSALSPEDNDGVVLCATSGALNLRLGIVPSGPMAKEEAAIREAEQELTVFRQVQPLHLRSVVGLVWRTVVMWLVLLTLLSLSRLLG